MGDQVELTAFALCLQHKKHLTTCKGCSHSDSNFQKHRKDQKLFPPWTPTKLVLQFHSTWLKNQITNNFIKWKVKGTEIYKVTFIIKRPTHLNFPGKNQTNKDSEPKAKWVASISHCFVNPMSKPSGSICIRQLPRHYTVYNIQNCQVLAYTK